MQVKPSQKIAQTKITKHTQALKRAKSQTVTSHTQIHKRTQNHKYAQTTKNEAKKPRTKNTKASKTHNPPKTP